MPTLPYQHRNLSDAASSLGLDPVTATCHPSKHYPKVAYATAELRLLGLLSRTPQAVSFPIETITVAPAEQRRPGKPLLLASPMRASVMEIGLNHLYSVSRPVHNARFHARSCAPGAHEVCFERSIAVFSTGKDSPLSTDSRTCRAFRSSRRAYARTSDPALRGTPSGRSPLTSFVAASPSWDQIGHW